MKTATLASFPITTAPIAAGKEFTCLLWPGPERYGPHWMIGRWNGELWRDDAGWVFEPTHWAPLPRPPRSTMIIDHEPAAAQRGAASAGRRGTVKGSTDDGRAAEDRPRLVLIARITAELYSAIVGGAAGIPDPDLVRLTEELMTARAPSSSASSR